MKKYIKYPQAFWDKLDQVLLDLNKTAFDGPIVAAFDADGTLWDVDIGEMFFEWQLKNTDISAFTQNEELLKRLGIQFTKPEELMGIYKNLKDQNRHEDAYYLLAQINQGHKIEDVRLWATQNIQDHSPLPIFEEQQKLFNHLQSKEVEIYVVTASVKWAVEPAARLYAIPEKNVIGIETKVKNGLVTTEKILPMTWKMGKVLGLLEKNGGTKPFLSSGNTMGDKDLLSIATHIKLAVSAAEAGSELYETEMSLQTYSKENRGFSHRFV